METKRPEVVIVVREWEPGEAVQIVVVRPGEIVWKEGGGGIDLAATPSTSYVLVPGGLVGYGVNRPE